MSEKSIKSVKRDSHHARKRIDAEEKAASKNEKEAPVEELKPEEFAHLPSLKNEIPYSSKIKEKDRGQIHPAILRLGIFYGKYKILGSNERCLSMLEAFKTIINSFSPPADQPFGRNLELHIKPQINYLVQCRPLAMSMGNTIRILKREISKIPSEMAQSEAKELIIEFIDTYIKNRIVLAGKLIVSIGVAKIRDDDVVLIYANSNTVINILIEAKAAGVKFKVVVVDSRPFFEGKKSIEALVNANIRCSYALLTSLDYAIQDVTKVILGAHCLYANGYLKSRVGTSVVAMMAHQYKIPCIVCCETYKFSDKIVVDSFTSNEIADPKLLVDLGDGKEFFRDWKSVETLNIVHFMHDVTPAEFITMVITEAGMIPSTSVPVFLREHRSTNNNSHNHNQ